MILRLDRPGLPVDAAEGYRTALVQTDLHLQACGGRFGEGPKSWRNGASSFISGSVLLSADALPLPPVQLNDSLATDLI